MRCTANVHDYIIKYCVLLFLNLSWFLWVKRLLIYISIINLYHIQMYSKVAAAAAQWAWGQMMICKLHVEYESWHASGRIIYRNWAVWLPHNPQNHQKSFQLWGLSKLKLFLESGITSRLGTKLWSLAPLCLPVRGLEIMGIVPVDSLKTSETCENLSAVGLWQVESVR